MASDDKRKSVQDVGTDYLQGRADMVEEITDAFMAVRNRTIWRLVDIIDILGKFQQEE